MKPLVGTPLDYSKKENWMFFNDLDTKDHDVDVFYLYPTSVLAEVKDDVCEDIAFMKKTAHINYLLSADTFASFTNMYAPYYRQLSGVAILKNPTEEKLYNALGSNVTRTDVYAALDYYFEHCNKGKPYILAGHSQGSIALKHVLSEYMEIHPEYLENMVACYAIGWYFPQSWFDAHPRIKKAAGETDTGVLITWNTEGPGGTKFSLTVGNHDGFCINPLNWRTDETPADVSLNKGSVFIDRDFAGEVFDFLVSKKMKEKLEKLDVDREEAADKVRDIITERTDGVADATIDLNRGVIVTTTYDDFLPDNPIFGDKSCHLEDWSLFTMNVRENAQKRIAAFLGREGQ